MAFEIKDLPEEIRAIKKNLREALPNHAAIFAEVEAEMKQRVATIVREREAGEDVIPTLQYADIEAGKVSPQRIAKIKERGAWSSGRPFPQSRPRRGTTRSPGMWRRMGSPQNLPTLPSTTTSATLSQPSLKSMAFTGHGLRCRLVSPNHSLACAFS